MDTYIQDTRVIIKNTCCALTNMHVPVKDYYLFNSMISLCDLSSHSHIVKKAKTSSCCSMCMMSWRSNNSECGINLVVTNGLYSFYSTTCSNQSSLRSKFILVRIIRKLSYILFWFQFSIMLFILTALTNSLNMFLTMCQQ